MKRAVSAILLENGKVIASIGQAVEDSQIEDGDPPYRISPNHYHRLTKAVREILEAEKSLLPKTDARDEDEDYGEDPLGER